MLEHDSKCPVSCTSLDLLDHSYDRVAAAFESFAQNWEAIAGRGGVKLPNRKPRGPLRGLRSPGYGVEMTPTVEQRAYWDVCMGALNNLTRGKTLRRGGEKPPSISEQMKTSFMKDRILAWRFGRLVAESTVSIFDRFGERYSNLMPAMEALVLAGGTEGVAIAIHESQSFLGNALAGKPDDGVGTLLGPDAAVAVFTKVHPHNLVMGDIKTHEVWCPGMAVAQSIVEQAYIAAKDLAATQRAQETYVRVGNTDSMGIRLDEAKTVVAESVQRMITSTHQA